MIRFGWVVVAGLLAGCAPQVAGQQVGQALFDASVSTGQALANFQDRTGAALQGAGNDLRRGVNPPADSAAPPVGYAPPPVFDPQGDSRFGRDPVQIQPLN